MATSDNLHMFEDHPRWEEYKFEKLRPSTTSSSPGKRVKKRYQPRRSLVRKEGKSNVAYRGIRNKGLHYVKDFYNSLLDLKWRYAFLVLFGGFLASYLTFAILYWVLGYVHGDFHNLHNPHWVPCFMKVTSFWDSLLFSIETQSTVGYGTLYPSPECGAANIPLVFLQMTLGVLLEAVILGMVFVKIARPKNRCQTIMFSRSVCVCQEDGEMCLQVRIGDLRSKTHLIDASVYAMVVQKNICKEKYVYPLYQHNMELTSNGIKDKIFLIWPMVLSHKITENSPLWNVRPEDLFLDKFEIIIFLEGTIETTGELMQSRTSYSASEIIWGHRFARIEEYDEKSNSWCIDFVRFDNVVPSQTPKCSAKEAQLLYKGTGIFKNLEKGSSGKRRAQSETDDIDSVSIASVDSYGTASESHSDNNDDDDITRRHSTASL
ncbi:ATP-sensitive inward rectifier potassium channel 11-like [Haliotis cracherodii]|uniref:ATP-sensitive inward rectifier potassium channel 11-like n=1 Tax=Haliotis cracherodii TaxID=6455 RepID=UPI0039EA2FB4